MIKIADHYGHQISDLTLTAATATVAREMPPRRLSSAQQR